MLYEIHSSTGFKWLQRVILKEVDLEGEIVLIKLSFLLKNIFQNDLNNKLYFDGKKVVVKKEA